VQYTIGSLARAADVRTSTVRYYERAGLLRPEGRSAGNYRTYSERSLERLLFIRAAQVNGFTLADVRRLLAVGDGGAGACERVQSLIETRLGDVEERLRVLRALRKVLRASLEECRREPGSERCEVLAELARGRPVVRSRRLRPPSGRGSRPGA
jgi:MerR family mercuric resistance operon transcriptional regulator